MLLNYTLLSNQLGQSATDVFKESPWHSRYQDQSWPFFRLHCSPTLPHSVFLVGKVSFGPAITDSKTRTDSSCKSDQVIRSCVPVVEDTGHLLPNRLGDKSLLAMGVTFCLDFKSK